MASQQSPGESKTINISTKKFANGFTATSWRIQSHQSWLRSTLLENPKPLIFKQKMCKWFVSTLLENPKPLIFKQKNSQMASQQPPVESKTINISTTKCANGFTTASWRIQNNKYFNKKMRKWLHNSILENPKPSICQ